MNITSNTYKNIYTQSGNSFSLAGDLVINNQSSSGKLDIGLSGTSNFVLSFGSGKILDHKKRFVETYRINEPISFSLNFDNNKNDIYINNKPVSFSNNFPYKFERIFVNTNGPTGTLTTIISGATPNFSVNKTGTMDSNGIITGNFVLNDAGKKLEIYDIENLDAGNGVVLHCINNPFSGSCALNWSGDIEKTGIYSHNFILKTNGGDLQTGITISNLSGVTGGYLNFFPLAEELNETLSLNGLQSSTGFYIASMFENTQLTELDFSLTYVSGSGASVFNLTGVSSSSTGYLYGNITGSGYLTGFSVSGDIYYNSGVSGHCLTTGYGRTLGYATGTFSKNWTSNVTGSGWYMVGDTPSGNPILSTGIISGTVTGTITGQNGRVAYSQAISGYPTVVSSASGTISGSGLFLGTNNGYITGSGDYSGIYSNVTQSGECTYSGDKLFTDVWKLQTGGYVNSGFTDFYDNNWYSANQYKDTGVLSVPKGEYRRVARIIYQNPHKSLPTDVVTLTFSNGIRTRSITITGQY